MAITPPVGVYRLYDQENVLLYVGVSDSMGVRWGMHQRRDWWPEVARYSIAWHEDRAQALCEEAQAIATESPRHNLAGPIPEPEASTYTEEEWLALPTEPRYQPRKGGPRRAKGEGSLFKRSVDGMWIASLNLGYDERGMLVRKTFSSKDRDTALAKMEAFKRSRP